jgi:ribosome-associated translation inhibitor RaiA
MICDLTGQLPGARRRDLETQLAALAMSVPGIDTVEVELKPAGGVLVAPCKHVDVTLRANHRRVVRVSEEAPTLPAALDLAMADVARKGEAFGAAGGPSGARTLH